MVAVRLVTGHTAVLRPIWLSENISWSCLFSFLMGTLTCSPSFSESGRTLPNEACDPGLDIFLVTSSYTERRGKSNTSRSWKKEDSSLYDPRW